jgi:CRISPR-associated endonuclease/helicase Cas3
MYAHSLRSKPVEDWEHLTDHLAAVAERAAQFAETFGFGEAGRVAGLLHDIGKVSQGYQGYIAMPDAGQPRRRGPDHSTAGAREASRKYPSPLGRMLACVIAGHHSGLADGAELDRRLSPDDYRIEPYNAWEAHVGRLAPTHSLRPDRWKPGPHRGFSAAFAIRMLFSSLVDADFLATEAFYLKVEGQPSNRGDHTDLATLRGRLADHMARLQSDAAAPVRALRQRVLLNAIDKATLAPGLFTMTVPTGGGKTLASLSFALEHAVRHDLRRVIYVIPFTSIIEQTAEVFRGALSTREDVLEHHASFDWDEGPGAEDEGPDGLAKLRKAAENWDVPIVVTTAVQFFESLYANRPSRCRKLHNLARAVIVLDEAQTLPVPLLRPCVAAADELARNYGTSVVLCTATQPALRQQDGFERGLEIDDSRELAPEPKALYAALKRVRVEVLPGKTGDETVAARFSEQPQMLCIVNSRAHARALFEAIRLLPGAVHLSTLMCPRHRRTVLAEARNRLRHNEPVRIVSTSLIEAGVDIDLPEVWRAAAGLDSINQAAGRCNRNGRLAEGRVVVFEPPDHRPPHAVAQFHQAAREVLRQHEDVLSLEAIHAYFRVLYLQKGEEALDAVEVDGRRGVLPTLADHASDWRFPFRSLADAFHLIEDAMEPVIAPWDDAAVRLLRELAHTERPTARHLRRLQQYTVTIPRRARDEWLRRGALAAAHPALGDRMLAFADLAHYRAETGLDIEALGLREALANIF